MKTRRLIYLLVVISTLFPSFFTIPATASGLIEGVDTIHSGWGRPLSWRIGLEASPTYLPGTNDFLKGDNPLSRRVRGSISGSVRADFSFSPDSREGILYKGLYQGIGVGVQSFFSHKLLGTPVNAYVYQGAPIVHFSERVWLGYEWNFGAAFGWHHHDEETLDQNAAVSTSVTALMALGLKLHYTLSPRWQLSVGVVGQHFSNGNTSWPNAGVNTIGASVGISYAFAPDAKDYSYRADYNSIRTNNRVDESKAMRESTWESIRGRWMYDLVVYGAWRKKVVSVGIPPMPELCPGKFGIAGLQFSPLRSINRYVAIGPSLDLQWDESGGLEEYWVEGSVDDNIKFHRPPFGRQISVGLSAHAELTMPVFAVNAGLGYDFLKPAGEKRFYQSLTLKTFVTRRFFLNVGYRLADFKHPQNLMLGLGLRL